MQAVTWYWVGDFALCRDARPLLSWCQQQDIGARVTEENNQQRLWITQQEHVPSTQVLLQRWLSGELVINANTLDNSEELPSQSLSFMATIKLNLRRCPVTIILILCGVMGAFVISFRETSNVFYWLIFQAVDERGLLSLEQTLLQQQYWRLITPAFLHFGWMHIVFNALILWELGRRFELAKGSLHLTLLFLLSAVVTNTVQYWFSPNVLFGGLSGVNYMLIGYIAVYQRFIPHPILFFQESMIAFFIVWLLLGVFGIIDIFIQGSIANAAHVSGLLLGAAIGVLMVWRDRAKLPSV